MHNIGAARPKPEQGFYLDICGRYRRKTPRQHLKGNGAYGRRRRQTGQRHCKAFASVFISPTQAPPSTAIEGLA